METKSFLMVDWSIKARQDQSPQCFVICVNGQHFSESLGLLFNIWVLMTSEPCRDTAKSG